MDDSDFLTYFSILSSDQSTPDVCKKASEDIFKSVLAASHQTESLISNSVFSLGSISKDLVYTLKKIIDILSSSTISTQFNFTPILSMLLAKFSEIDLEKYLVYIEKECNVSNAVRKSENKHFQLGKILAFHALTLSNRIDKHPKNMQIFNSLVDSIQNLVEEENWIEEIAVKTLENLTCNSSVSNKKQKITTVLTKFKPKIKQNNINFVYLLLVFNRHLTKEFAYSNFLENLMLNYNNLLPLLLQTAEIFPRESLLFKEIVNYLWNTSQKNENAKLFWQNFWDFFIKELVIAQDQEEIVKNQSSYKKFFIVLCLLRNFLKIVDLDITRLSLICNKELLALWLRNLNVLNKSLKEIAHKIEKKVIKLITKVDKNEENKEILLEFILAMKEKPLIKFISSNPLAKIFYDEILTNEISIDKYSKFLKKKIHSSEKMNERLFYLSDMMHLIDCKMNNFNEEKLIDLCFFIYTQTDNQKIKNLLNLDLEEDDLINDNDVEITKNKNQIFDNFFNVLSYVNKRNSKNFEKKKNAIWKGFNENNELLILIIFEKCVNHACLETKKENKNNETFISEKLLNFLSEFKKIQIIIQNEMKHIENKSEIKKKISLLEIMISVGLFSLQYPDEGIDSLEELIQIYQEYNAKKNKKIKLNNGKSNKNIKYVNVLIDLMISLLTKSTNFMRESIRKCFNAFLDEINEKCIETMTNVIIRKNEDYIKDMEEEDD